MIKAILLQLEQSAHLSPQGVRTANPQLFAALAAKATEPLKTVLKAAFGDSSPAVQSFIESIDLATLYAPGEDITAAMQKKVAAARLTPAQIKELADRLQKLQESGELVDPFTPDTPLGEQPLIQTELQQEKTYRLAEIVGLPDANVEAMFANGHTIATLNDDTLQTLVTKASLNDTQARELGLAANLYHLFDDTLALAKVVKTSEFLKLPGKKVSRLRDLALFTPTDWVALLNAGNITPPDKMTVEAYAADLNRRVAALYPTDTLLARIPRDDAASIQAKLEQLQPLYAHNNRLFDGDFACLDTTGLTTDQSTQMQATHTQLLAIVNTHPGLGLAEVLDNPAMPTNIRGTQAATRLDLLTRVRQLNPDLELLDLDYGPESKDFASIKLSGLTVDEIHQTRSWLKASQRIQALTGNAEFTEKLLEVGYSSASAIANDDLATFLTRTGLDEAKGRSYYDSAGGLATHAANALGTVFDIVQGGFDSTAVSNQNTVEIENYLKKLDGYATLFGSQSYCRCEHCRSIFGPAAYFVDLMYFVEKNVLKKYFAGAKATHVLSLEKRRPDLWTLELTCKNTNDQIPTLDVINEVLENYIAKEVQNFTGDLKDRTAVEKAVYEPLASSSIYSLQQPFVLPLETLQTYLAHFNYTRAAVAQTIGANWQVVDTAALKLSKQEYDLITLPNATLPFLQALYGIEFQIQANGTIPAFDAQALLKPLGISRTTLGDLLATRFVTAVAGTPIEIRLEKIDEKSVQNDIERIYNLTPAVLERMHRFIRLQRRLPWSIAELDLVRTHFKEAGLGGDEIGPHTPSLLADLCALQDRFGISVEELCAWWDHLPRWPVTTTGKSLFERRFNPAAFLKQGTVWPNDGMRFIHPAFRSDGTAMPADNTLPRLLAGLGVSAEELYQMITHPLVRGFLGINLNSPNEQGKGFMLTAKNLSLLYRHTQMATHLKLSIPEYFQLLEQSGSVFLTSVGDLTRLVEFYDWWKTTDYTLDELGFITHKTVRNPATYPDSKVIAQALVAEVKAERALTFAATLFAFDKLTEAQSLAMIQANAALIEGVADRNEYQLSSSFSPTVSLKLPENVSISADAVKTILLKYHPSEIVPARLAGKLNLTVEKTKALIRLTGESLVDPAFALALRGTGSLDRLVALVDNLLRLSVLFRNPVFDAATLDLIMLRKDIFATPDFTSIGIASIRKLWVYSAFTDTTKEALFAANAPMIEASEVRDVLATFTPAQKFAATDKGKLARLLRTDIGLVATLLTNVTLPDSVPEALLHLARCAKLARDLGVDGETLKLITATDYGLLARASDALLSAFRAKYSDESEWQEQIEPFEDQLRTHKRAALTDYLLHHPQFKAIFATSNDLYHYFLIDVELEGCARTSRVVAAISSVQLYVHRILMNLEQDQRTDSSHVHVEPTCIPPEEWVWRKNYRVWEANRKVFLYPENYIEPDLRDDKTPLFKELEANLLQQEINEESVLDAYAAYMRGFEEVATLKIAGSYHDKDEVAKVDILHLFGVTPTNPPLYFYRTGENLVSSAAYGDRGIVWSPWRKIEVQIPAGRVSPVVFQERLYLFWVEITTLPKNKIENGESKFTGYTHTLVWKYTSLRLDGTWTAPQPLTAPDYTLTVDDSFVPGHYKQPKYNQGGLPHEEPRADYTLTGFQWNQIYPDVIGRLYDDNDCALAITGRNFERFLEINLYRKSLDSRNKFVFEPRQWPRGMFHATDTNGSRLLYFGYPNFKDIADKNSISLWKDISFIHHWHAFYSILLEKERFTKYIAQWESPEGDTWKNPATSQAEVVAKVWSSLKMPVAQLTKTDELDVVNGSRQDCIIDAQATQMGDVFLVQNLYVSTNKYQGPVYRRIGNTLSAKIASTLCTGGVDSLLSTKTQQGLREAPSSIFWLVNALNLSNTRTLDFRGPYGVYHREIFFQIPFLIANHLNGQQRFAAARRWYHYIFDPTANETTDPPRDRNWRYLEFRGIDLPKLREALMDKDAIETYKRDPFNPHAIARLRLSAYQKSIVMKYIDNLLDWGDSLFTQFTTESVNEAALLYILAADILGERPVEFGSCSEETAGSRTYTTIRPALDKGSEFLMELESETQRTVHQNPTPSTVLAGRYMLDPTLLRSTGQQQNRSDSQLSADRNGGIFRGYDWKKTHTASWSTSKPGSWSKADALQITDHGSPLLNSAASIPAFTRSVVRQIGPVFCVPPNQELYAYWDRVEDRLYKIRNCMDIAGVRRQLALFAPAIDPRLLVRMRAAGLSLEDVLNAISGNLPPYRFAYLIEKAKQYAGTVQSLGTALLSAMEKKDVEELTRLRATHEQNLLKLNTQVKQWEIDAAEQTIQSLEKQKETVTYRKSYYQGLIDKGLTDWEHAEQTAQMTASALRGVASILDFVSGVTHLIPELGAPTSLKYGGKQAGNSTFSWAEGMRDVAIVAESVASAAKIEATNDRREQEWTNQRDLADRELKQLDRQLEGAKIHKEITIRSQEIHQKTTEQAEEVYQFYGDKFSNYALYTWLSTRLHQLYREAYNSAYAMARLVEQAFHFERGEESTVVLQASYWEASKAGLLAGERLLLDLQNMERRFIETNYRTLEINQSFSLMQIDPRALIGLRESGSCNFTIPEVVFDLFYPGQYRRKIKAVRLTIPCVTGPYTNVSAILRLKSSGLRNEPKVEAALLSVPLQRSVCIATSSAQNDAGVFELNFHDERYMPFEGAGAVNSSWQLDLPKNFRQFDYQTISDVILHINYMAEEDDILRKKMEGETKVIESELYKRLQATPSFRIFSLRQEFPSEFHRLMHSPVDTEVKIKIGHKHFPLFLQGFLGEKKIVEQQAKLVLQSVVGQAVGRVKLNLNGTDQEGFEVDDTLGNLPVKLLDNLFINKTVGVQEFSFKVSNAGDLAPESPVSGDLSAIDDNKLLDILLYVKYLLVQKTP